MAAACRQAGKRSRRLGLAGGYRGPGLDNGECTLQPVRACVGLRPIDVIRHVRCSATHGRLQARAAPQSVEATGSALQKSLPGLGSRLYKNITFA